MIRGLYTAASGMMTAMRRMEMVTNNLANAQTTGFKQERTATSTFAEALIQVDGTPAPLAPNPPLGQMGMATVSEEPLLDFTQGALQESGRNLDMALEGPGFFTVQTQEGTRYTRDGAFTRDANGNLTTTEGDLVMGEDGNPITIPGGRIQVEPDGTVQVADQTVGKLAVVEFNLDQPLRKVGNNQFATRNDGDQPHAATTSAVRQNFIESSNVDMAGAQTTMLELQRAYDASQRMVQYQDELVGRAVNDIARPSN
jgi:flagellar basal-body rod protein FlgF